MKIPSHLVRTALLLGVFLLAAWMPLTAQELFLRPDNREVEEFLDELATERIISLNSSVRPYSRLMIAARLCEARGKRPLLSPLQRKELDLYLSEFRQEILTAGLKIPTDSLPGGTGIFRWSPLSVDLSAGKKTLYSLSVRPLMQGDYGVNQNGSWTRGSAGAGLFGYAGRHWAYAFTFEKGYQSQPMTTPAMLRPENGHVWNRYSNGAGGYSEWSGQLSYSWNWGSVAVLKGRADWGEGYHGTNIFSDKAPPFAQIRIHVKPAKWIEFTWLHGWLNSGVVDSTTFTGPGDGSVSYIPKYLSANLLTVTPWRGLDLSFGNSVVYSDKLQPAYLIPVLFYKSIDHTLYPLETSQGLVGDNAQMFLSISSRQIRHLHLYLTLFVDELMISRITDPDLHNFFSWKAGFRLSNFPVQNLRFTAEMTRTQPMVYQHEVAVTTFASDGYTLGNYLGDNAQEYYLALSYRLLRGLQLSGYWRFVQRGDDFVYGKTPNPAGTPMLENIIWQDNAFGMSARYAVTGNASAFLNWEYSKKKGDIGYNPVVLHGTTSTFSLGFSIGL